MCLEGSDGFVTSTAAPIATGWNDRVAGWELHPLKTHTFARRTLAASPFPLSGSSSQTEARLEPRNLPATEKCVRLRLTPENDGIVGAVY